MHGQRPRRSPVRGHAQLIDRLIERPALGQRMGLGQSAFVARHAVLACEEAQADLRLFQGTLIEDRFEQEVAQIFGQHLRMMPRLDVPDLAELILKVPPVGVEIVSRLFLLGIVAARDGQPRAHRWRAARVGRGGTAQMQKRAIAARALQHHRLIEPRGGVPDLAAFIVAAIGLAVAFEAPALVEVKQRPAEVGQRQRLVERPGAQFIRIERFERLGLRRVLRHQPCFGEAFHQRGAASEVTVAPAAHGPGVATPHGKGRTDLAGCSWFAPIGEDAHAEIDDAGNALAFQSIKAPADGVGADVESEAGCGTHDTHRKRAYELTAIAASNSTAATICIIIFFWIFTAYSIIQ